MPSAAVPALAAVFLAASVPAGAGECLLSNPSFSDNLADWSESGAKGVHSPAGEAGTIQFTPPPAVANVHLDQLVQLPKNSVFFASVETKRVAGTATPALRISNETWDTVSHAEAGPGTDWQRLQTTFFSGPDSTFRFQLFGGGRVTKRIPADTRTQFRNPSLRIATAAEAGEMRTARVTIRPDKITGRIDPRFFGVNSLFWITDDASRADSKIADTLKRLPCGLIRYPGGEIADNFHWKTNLLDDKKEFPFSDGPAELDFDEFIPWCRDIGAEPICVINLESCFKSGNIEAGIEEATAWVHYSNIEKGYAVKLWELGNETDLIVTRFPLTAREYAHAVSRFSKAMKTVDPTIRIGALGPIQHDHVAPIDALTPAALGQLRAMTRGKRRTSHRDLERNPIPGPKWWPTLVKLAGDDFDFAIIHRYDASRKSFNGLIPTPIRIGERVAELDHFLKQQTGHEVPLALTEWNVSKNCRFSPIEHAVTIAELVCNYLDAGVDMANYWPMRYGRSQNDDDPYFRALLDLDSKKPRAAYHVLQLFATRAGASRIEATSSLDSVRVLATAPHREHGTTLFITNPVGWKQGVKLVIDETQFSIANATTLVTSDTDPGIHAFPLTGTPLTLPPLSITRIELEPR